MTDCFTDMKSQGSGQNLDDLLIQMITITYNDLKTWHNGCMMDIKTKTE